MPFVAVFQKIPRNFRIYYGLVFLWLLTTAMHIPDGYLSPVTCMIMFIIILPFWVRGVQKLRQKMSAQNIPLIALMAAFSFIIMMFNVPIPGGTTAHAVGGALIAILLGPEIATVTVSIALLVQALFFGDGGILSFAANCFNMAVVLPYISYAIYQVITRNSSITSRRRIIGSAVGAWFGLTIAAFCTGFEFGIQPVLFHTATGTPLYAPYPLSVSIPAMVIPHALIASVVEGLVTALVITYLQRANQPALKLIKKEEIASEASGFARWRILWIGLAVLVVATPIGLLAPGSAWGEWGAGELTSRGLAFVPQGLAKLSDLWGAPLKNYNLPSLGNSNLGYILSALVGIIVITLVVWLFTTLITNGKKSTPEIEKGM